MVHSPWGNPSFDLIQTEAGRAGNKFAKRIKERPAQIGTGMCNHLGLTLLG